LAFRIETVEIDGGARLGICPLPGRFGDALADLASIAKWAPDIVVSTTEPAEMARHNVEDLAGLLASAGIAHESFAIRDFGVPEATSEWRPLADRLHAMLDAGGAVLAHCYGGQGRSGMVLLRLMVERGEDPDRALRRLRSVRPGAVETDAQYAWALEGRG
jgi:protein-tyrosine phosphatase